MSQITPLHLHTHFSALGGPHSPRDWCEHALSLGYRSLGIADRAPLAAYPEFAAAARDNGITPLFGVKLDLLIPVPGAKATETALQPVLLFARDSVGLDNLAKLSGVAFAGWPRSETLVEWDVLAALSGGLLVVLLPMRADGSAPLGSVQPKKLSEIGARLHETFDGAAFMGLPNPTLGGDTHTRQAAATANYLGLAPVALPTARYLGPNDAPAHAALHAARARAGWSLSDAPMSSPPSRAHYLLPPDEATALYAEWPDAIANCALLVEMCLETSGDAPPPAADRQPPTALHERVERELRRLLGDELPEAARERAEQELAAIRDAGHEASWLALATLCETSRRERIPLGAPLGSASDSLVAYALGISPLDPLPYPPPHWLTSDAPAPPGIEIPGSRLDALLTGLVADAGRDSLAHAACIMDLTPLYALSAAADMLATPPDTVAQVATRALEGGWDALVPQKGTSGESYIQQSDQLAALAYTLKDAPLLLKPDPETLVFMPSAGRPAPPLLRPVPDSHGWTPWTEQSLRALGNATLTLRPTDALKTLDAALTLTRRHPAPGFRVEESEHSVLPILSDGAGQLLQTGKLTGVPYLTPEAARSLATIGVDEPERPNAFLAALETATGDAPKTTHYAWGRIALLSANLKAAHPATLLAGSLDVAWRGGGRNSMAGIAADAQRHNIAILPPDVALSNPQPDLEPVGPGWAIRWGLVHLPGWDDEAARRFTEARSKEKVSVDSLSQLARIALEAGLSEAQMVSLIKAGACDTLGGRARGRDEMIALLPTLLERLVTSGESPAQLDLFNTAQVSPTAPEPSEEGTFSEVAPSPLERYNRREWEKRNLGVGFTMAPEMDGLGAAVKRSGSANAHLLTSGQVTNERLGESVVLVGLLCGISVVEPPDEGEAGARIATAHVEDTQGCIELVAFPPNYKRHQALWTEANPVIVTARVSAHDDGELYLLCEHLAALNGAEVEEVVQIKVQPQKGGARPVKEPVPQTEVLATPARPRPPINDSLPVANHTRVSGNGNYATTPAAASATMTATATAAATLSTGDGEPASYRIVISLPSTDNDHDSIDAMIALNAVLIEHPGPDIVSIRIPYLAGTRHVATAQLPRGINFTLLLRDRLESLFGTHALAVIELG